ncbi:hypothetical protein KC675_04235 [Candidatus Dojkabacteria bacterium]|jgi:hypothetical protein|uniref:Uncharacterized protein n=1 Tax=Candidatus Dojkabacteria bacterium TaxID=2099670 RepID=A0A955L0N7_9BACT|nr:hypothetical protein [Candidatus Dojkabacteria bacterium]
MPNNNKPGRGSCKNNGYHRKFISTEPLRMTEGNESGLWVKRVLAIRTVICELCGKELESPTNIQQVFYYTLTNEEIITSMVRMEEVALN